MFDLAAMITAPDGYKLNQKIERTLLLIQTWMENNSLKLTLDINCKTVLVEFAGSQRDNLAINIRGAIRKNI